MKKQGKVKYDQILAFCSRDQKWLLDSEAIAIHIRDCVPGGNFVILKEETNEVWKRIKKEKENELDFT